MNVSLTPELEQYVSTKVSSGLYTSASEVVREGLRLLKERDQVSVLQLTEIRAKIAEGLAQLERREFIDPDVLRAELRQKSRARRNR